MSTMTANGRRLAAGMFGTLALATLSTMLQAQTSVAFTSLAKRLSDTVITRDLAHFDSLARVAPNARSAALIGLARDAYERNDDGALTARLLAMSGSAPGDASARAHRPALWALLDSLERRTAMSATAKEQAIALEVALLRAGSPLLGAPSCANWDQLATRYAEQLRQSPPPVLVAVPAPVVATPVVAPPAPRPKAPAAMRAVPSRVHFALDQATLAPASRRVLDALVDSLSPYVGVRIVLEGHTDLRGSVAYNVALSKRRVEAVRDYLLRKGLDPSRIGTVAHGKAKLEMTEPDVTSQARNRRVMFQLFDAQGREIPTVGHLDDLQLERR